MQEQSRPEKPKVNRLRRAKRSTKPDLVSSVCDVIIRPAVTRDQKCSQTSNRKAPAPDGAQCSPPTHGLLLHRKLGQNKHDGKSESDASLLLRRHHQPSGLADEALIRTGPREGRSERELSTGFGSDPTSWSLRARTQSSDEFFKDAHTREEFLTRVRAQNLRFPVQRLFQTLLKRRGDSESGSAAGKRKQEVESRGDGRRQRSSQDDTETGNGSDWGVSGRNALRRTRVCVQNTAVEETRQDEGRVGDDEEDDDDDGGHHNDVPWTEKYRPRSCDEVVGNSVAVGRLYSWLREWRIRADVEERRKRREERRMKKETNGSWDCGDFEGDPLTEECEGELCNTLLIHGPTGAGKTAAVFACAEQLGFKVLEVNSSSLRSGRLVLSQLRESTQSHQVGAPQGHTAAAAASREAAAGKSKSCCKNLAAIRRAASRKKRCVTQTPVTPACHFTKSVNKLSELPSDTRTADEVTREASGTEEDGALDKKDKTPPISLILFEEVDVTFEEDVGFLAAVKSLMSTTKRPIVLTTNDASFGETFAARYEEIRFQTPATESVVSYLQCVCAVEDVKTDPDHIRFMLQENSGDVRRSVLELELWARSGAGNTHYRLHNRALGCKSYTELESSRCVDVLLESWRKGRSLLYSNLDLLLAPPTIKKAPQSTFDQNGICAMFRNTPGEAPPPSGSRRRSRLRLKKRDSESALSLDRYKQPDQSAAAARGVSQVDSLARFCDTVSFVDSHLSLRPRRKSATRGAKIADGVLDEPREEGGEDGGAGTRGRGLERCYEIMAVVEGLGLQVCRMRAWPGDQDGTRGDANKTLKLSEDGDVPRAIRRLLCSKAFRCHGDQTAVLTDYLPCLRFICREQRAEGQGTLRVPDYLQDIGLRLPKSVLNTLASQLR